MIQLFLFPVLAFAFARAPAATCQLDGECVLVQHTYCGTLSAITVGQDERWADFERREREKAAAAKQACPAGSRQDHRLFEPACERGQCVVRQKTPKK